MKNSFSPRLCPVPGIEDPGLQPDEYEASIQNLKSISEVLDAHFLELNRRKVDEGTSGHCLIRKRLAEQDFVEIRYLYTQEIKRVSPL